MVKISEEEGKRLVENFFEIGKWYCFDTHNGNFDHKYLKVSKLTFDDNRVYIKGTGFTELNGKLLNPTIKKEECICYVWANEYLEYHIWEILESQVIEAFDKATQNLKENLFG